MYIVKVYNYWNNEITSIERNTWNKAIATARFYAKGRNWTQIQDEDFNLYYHVESSGIEIDYRNRKIEKKGI